VEGSLDIPVDYRIYNRAYLKEERAYLESTAKRRYESREEAIRRLVELLYYQTHLLYQICYDNSIMSRRKLELVNHLSTEELKTRYRSCKDPKEARRWQALWLLSQGYSSEQAANIVGLQASWVRKIINRYNQDGPQGVVDGHNVNPGGPKPRLSAGQRQELFEALKAEPPSGGLWTGPKVAAWIEQRTGIKTYPQLGWVYLRDLGFSLKVPRRKHPKSATPQQREAFKKNSTRR
jgi:transposase